jgi:hypothetical protein
MKNSTPGWSGEAAEGFDQASEALETVPAVRDGLVGIAYFSGTRTHEDDFNECALALALLLRRHPAAHLMRDGSRQLPTDHDPAVNIEIWHPYATSEIVCSRRMDARGF